MNSKKIIQAGLILVAAIATFTISSCQKDKNETPAPSGKGTLFFHLHTNVDTAEVEDYGTVYTMSNNRKISVNRAQLYICYINLIKLDGTTYSVAGKTILTKNNEEVYEIGSVPAGNYKSISFTMFVAPTTGTMNPQPGDSTLNQPVMWYGTTAMDGYCFINFSGTIDTTTAANGTIAQMQPFSYKLGTAAYVPVITLPDHNYTVSPNQAQYIHVTMDYNKLFTGIALNQSSNLSVTTKAENATPVGTAFANNFASIFSYEE